MTQEERINDMQMQINTLKMEFGRLNNVMNVLHKRITKLQEMKEGIIIKAILEKEKYGQLSPDTIKELERLI